MGERLDLQPLIVVLYAALYESIAAHSRLGLNVVVDVGHHDCYSKPRGILFDCDRRLSGLPVLFVGGRCPVEIIMAGRRKTWSNLAIAAGGNLQYCPFHPRIIQCTSVRVRLES